MKLKSNYKREKTWFIPDSLKNCLSKNCYTIIKTSKYGESTPMFIIKNKNKIKIFTFFIVDYKKRNLHNYIISEIKRKIDSNAFYLNHSCNSDIIKLKLNIIILSELLNNLKK